MMEPVYKVVPIESLHEDPANARRHGERNRQVVRSSLKEFGQVEALVVNKEGRVLGGNCRLKELRDLGVKDVSVIEVDLDKVDQTRLALVLNRSAELAEWDEDVLKSLSEDIDLGALGWDDPFPEDPEDPEKEELPVEYDGGLGDGVRLFHGNNVDVLRGIESDSIDLTVTSPPYDNLRKYTQESEWTFELFQEVAQELYRVTKQGGVVVWVVGDASIDNSETGTSFRQALYFKEIGFNLHDTMIYKKNALAFPEHNRYYQCFEYMFVFSKGAPKTTNLIADRENSSKGKVVVGQFRGRWKDEGKSVRVGDTERLTPENSIRWNIWDYNIGWKNSYTEEYISKHPAVFPEKLAEDHILSWSNPGDTVLDPFLGSGTTGKMSVLNRRMFVGIEVSSEYFEIAKKRIGEANADNQA